VTRVLQDLLREGSRFGEDLGVARRVAERPDHFRAQHPAALRVRRRDRPSNFAQDGLQQLLDPSRCFGRDSSVVSAVPIRPSVSVKAPITTS
jgi:hypothetical protein